MLYYYYTHKQDTDIHINMDFIWNCYWMVFFACPRNHLTCISRVIKCLFDSMNLTHRTPGLKSTQRRFGQYIYMLLIQNILTYNPIYLFVCYTIEMAHAASYEPLMRCTNEFTTNKINKNYCQIWNINKTLGIQLGYKKKIKFKRNNSEDWTK